MITINLKNGEKKIFDGAGDSVNFQNDGMICCYNFGMCLFKEDLKNIKSVYIKINNVKICCYRKDYEDQSEKNNSDVWKGPNYNDWKGRENELAKRKKSKN